VYEFSLESVEDEPLLLVCRLRQTVVVLGDAFGDVTQFARLIYVLVLFAVGLDGSAVGQQVVLAAG